MTEFRGRINSVRSFGGRVGSSFSELLFNGSGPAYPSPHGRCYIRAGTPSGVASYADGPEHGYGDEYEAFMGATTIRDGRVVLAPHFAEYIGIFDYRDDSLTEGPEHGEGGAAFMGATELLDGRVLLVPYQSSYFGLYDPVGNTYSRGPEHGQGPLAFGGSVMVSDGRVVLIPFLSANVGIFDSSNDSYVQGPVHGGSSLPYYSGGSCVDDDLVVLVSFGHGNMGVFDPTANDGAGSLTNGAAAAGYVGMIEVLDGTFVMTPGVLANVGLYNASTDVVSVGAAHGASFSTIAFVGSIILPDNRVLLCPSDAENIVFYTPGGSCSNGPLHGQPDDAYRGATLLRDGRALLVPCNADCVGLVDMGFGPILPTYANVHPLINKMA